jgi:hypothetical protein
MKSKSQKVKKSKGELRKCDKANKGESGGWKFNKLKIAKNYLHQLPCILHFHLSLRRIPQMRETAATEGKARHLPFQGNIRLYIRSPRLTSSLAMTKGIHR